MKPGLTAILLTAALTQSATGQPLGKVEWTGPVGSGKSFLTATANGELLLTWLESRSNGRYALQLARRSEGKWTPPTTIAESELFFVNWADFPSITAGTGGLWAAHWLERTAPKAYAYHVRVVTSRDRGQTWSTPITLHSDRSTTEHGFVAMAPNVDGSIAAAWLDGRAMVDSSGAMSVRAATLRPNGTIHGETVLDLRSCECCQVAMTRTEAGLLAAYRDRSPDEVRDIVVVRQRDNRWLEPVPVARDNWVWRACPVNGPAIAARGSQVAVAWYTAAGETPRVKVAFSADGGGSFATPIVVDDGNPLGRVHLQMVSPASAVLVWLESREDRAEWRVRRISGAGTSGPSRLLATTVRTREAGFPRTAQIGDDLFTAWTAPGDTPAQSRVTVTRVSVRTLP